MMSESYTFSFRVDAAMFRRALYFNTFFKQRVQVVIVSVMWLLGAGIALAGLALHRELSNVMWLCGIVLLVTLPLLVFSCEYGYRQYRDSAAPEKLRRVCLSSGWLKLGVSGAPDSEKLEWRQISSAFELSDFFIIYRDASLMVVLPKSAMTECEANEVRGILAYRLGRGFHERTNRLPLPCC